MACNGVKGFNQPVFFKFKIEFANTFCLTVLTVFLASWLPPAGGTTIKQVSIEELVADSVLVVEAQVADVSAAPSPENHKVIMTVVTLDVIEVIKGKVGSKMIELSYLGGRFGDREMKISGLKYPSVGERGIYFVESTSSRLVNPLLGWNQGHFVLLADNNGVVRVHSNQHRAVIGLQLGKKNDIGKKNGAEVKPLVANSAVAKGVLLGKSISAQSAHDNEGLEVSEFKNKLRAMMD